MYSLDKKQVDIIVADVQQAAITLSHLADDLVDHICCEVEELISAGDSFEKAYEKVKMQTGISVLKKIQENTQFLINKNYRLMKTTMKITGNISLAMLGIATVFKIMHWPGAGIGFVLGFFLLCVVFFPLALYTNFKFSGKKQNLLLHITVFLGGLMFMTGVLFKIMHWPGAGNLLFVGYIALLLLFMPFLLIVQIKKAKSRKDKWIYFIGVVSIIIYGLSNMFKMFHWPGAAILMLLGAFLLIAVFLPLFTWRRIQLEGKITGQFIYIVTISMFLILLNSLVALNVSKNVLGGFVNQAENSELLNNYLERKNNNLYNELLMKKDSLDLNSKSMEVKRISNEMNEYISNLQSELIMKTENINSDLANTLVADVQLITKKDNKDMVYLYLFGNDGQGKARELKEKLLKFISDLRGIIKMESLTANILNDLESDVNTDKMKYNKTWEESYFLGNHLIGTICLLKEIQIGVREIESNALENLQNN